jgi:exosortase
MKGSDLPADRRRWPTAWWVCPLLAALAWAYWPTLERMARRWSSDAQYTHAYVVPLFAAIVLWFRRDRFPRGRVAPSWWGLPLLLLGIAVRMAGARFSFEWLDAGSLLPSLAGVVLLALGPAVLRWAWPAATFLLFILPWPFQVDLLLTAPLRRVATLTSTYALQTLGMPALARGNIIVVNDLEVGVVEACSGLGMLMTFFALSTAVALVIDRPLFDRVVIFLSAAPVGVLMNVVRITVTVILYRLAGERLAKVVFHDVAGWVMMPMALAVLWLELLWLGRLWRPAEATGPVPVRAPAGKDPLVKKPGAGREEGDEGALALCAAQAALPVQEIPDAAQ